MKIIRKNTYLYGEEPRSVPWNWSVILELIIFLVFALIVLSFIFRIAPVIEIGLKGSFRESISGIFIFFVISPFTVHFVARAIVFIIEKLKKNKL